MIRWVRSLVRSGSSAWIACAASVVAGALLGACGGTAAPVAKTKAAPAPTVDVCEGSKPPWREYDGPLEGVRCEQEQFSRMATITTHLDVECGYCHVPKEGERNDFEFPAMTEKKLTALWMHRTFFEGLKRKDGKETECRHCHVNKEGKPAAKFLGSPRDVAWTVEWMTTRMTNDFVLQDGSKLKCKHCHDAAWGMKAFSTEVIGRDLPFVKPAEPQPAPSAPAPPAAATSAAPAPSASVPPAPGSAPPAPSGSAPVRNP